MVGKGPADRSPVGPGPAAARRASSAMVPVRRSAGRGTWKRDGIMRKEDGPIRHKENGAARFRCPCRESNPEPLWGLLREAWLIRAWAGARPEDRTRRCSVIHHWASSDACSAPAVTAFLRRRATAMATPAAASAAAAAAMP